MCWWVLAGCWWVLRAEAVPSSSGTPHAAWGLKGTRWPFFGRIAPASCYLQALTSELWLPCRSYAGRLEQLAEEGWELDPDDPLVEGACCLASQRASPACLPASQPASQPARSPCGGG